MGVRVVYIAHETNNRFAGAAYHHTEDLTLPNELTASFSRDIKFATNSSGRNAIGLTPTGRELVHELIRHHTSRAACRTSAPNRRSSST
jgi:microsomal dipeptidase-like Zn-dependent dipeptidase